MINNNKLIENFNIKNNLVFEAINWNEDKDGFSQVFWQQFIKQFWVDTEIGVSRDKKQWERMTPEEKQVFKQNFAGLTLFDTLQSERGMPNIKEMTEDKVQKAVLGFMEMMESIHAKSYSTIFTTLMEKHEIDELFDWVKENRYLQLKVNVINSFYEKALSGDKKDLYRGMAASVFLESFLFYSGFYYPLYLAGQGRMMASADIINLIIRDEALHGVYVGMLAQNLYKQMTPEEQEEVTDDVKLLLEGLVENEIQYTHEVYGVLGNNIVLEVIEFVKYNANKALQNLDMEPMFKGVTINPIVENGLDTDTKMHDFFSVKGNGYIKANTVPVTDEHFEEVLKMAARDI